MNFKFLFPVVALLIVLIFFAFSKVDMDNSAGKTINSNQLDNISVVPEWLNVVVDNALPDKGLNVWVPTGNFQFSSLIRVPRFPRSFTEEKLLLNPFLKKI